MATAALLIKEAVKQTTNTMKTAINSLVLIITFNSVISGTAQTKLIKEEISAKALTAWQTLDKGKTTVNEDELIMEEVAGSDGYFLISPKSYEGDIILNYKVKALSESAVCIVLLSASDQGETLKLTLPPKEAKGRDFWDWRTQLEHYNLTFNNRSHNYTPFFFKNRAPRAKGFHLSKAENIMKTQEWQTVEIGKQGTRLWFKLNNTIIFEEEDCKPFSGGHVIFRISGTNSEKTIFAKVAMKDLVISHQ